MKRVGVLMAVVMGVMLLFTGVAVAKVSGPCVNCHTMHWSQHGTTPTSSYHGGTTIGSDGPYETLLVNDCAGCHSGASAIIGAIPIVLRTSAPSGTGPQKSLAGGDFYWVNAGDPEKGHDVIDLPGISGQDSNIGLTPPGWDPNATPGALGDGQIHDGASSWTNQLTCAGKYGCHGRHDETTNAAAIAGAHHGDDSCLKPGTVDQSAQGADITTSYRWLGGIEGIEDPDWEWTATDGTTDHNQYKGVNGNSSYGDKTTISYLCAQCHGYFHSDIGSWTRHPTDIVLPSDTSKEYYKYNGGTGSDNDYSVVAPVGSTTFTDNGYPEDKITPGSTDSIVLCISCHRAHGTEYDDLLRWDYSSMVAGGGAGNEGCFICHTTKDD